MSDVRAFRPRTLSRTNMITSPTQGANTQDVKAQRAAKLYQAALDFYNNHDYESCVRLLDRSIMMNNTTDARKLRAAAQQQGVGHPTTNEFPNSPKVMRRSRSLLASMNPVDSNDNPIPLPKKPLPKSNSLRLPHSGTVKLSRSESLKLPRAPLQRSEAAKPRPFKNPSRLTRSKSLQCTTRTRLTWPRESPSKEDASIDRKRFRRSQDSAPFEFDSLANALNDDTKENARHFDRRTSSVDRLDAEFDFSPDNPNVLLKKNGFLSPTAHRRRASVPPCFQSPIPGKSQPSKVNRIVQLGNNSTSSSSSSGDDFQSSLLASDETSCSSGGTFESFQPPSVSAANMVFETPTREELIISSSNIDVTKQVDTIMNAGIRLVAIDFDETLVRVHTGGRWSHSHTELSQHLRPVFRKLIPAFVSQGIFVAIVTFSPQVKLIRQVLQATFPNIQLDKQVFVEGSRMEAAINEEKESCTPPRMGNTTREPCCDSPTTVMIPKDDDPNAKTPVLSDKERQEMVAQMEEVGTTTPLSADKGASQDIAMASRHIHELWSPKLTGKKAHLQSVLSMCHQANEAIEEINHRQILLIDDDHNNIVLAKGDGIVTIQFRPQEGGIAAEDHLLKCMLRIR